MKTLYLSNRVDWRAWLSEHHDTETEVWLIFYKKHTGQPGIPYNDAVEEALCFGWIDSLVKTLDTGRYAQKFTPRKLSSKWSESNKRRVRNLIEAGLMTQAGLGKITFPLSESEAEYAGKPAISSEPAEPELPDLIRTGLMANVAAWENFNRLARSYQANYIKWIMSARKEETRQKRLAEAIDLLEHGKKLGLK